MMKNDRSTTTPSVDKLARYYEEYYKYKRLIHKIRFGRFVLSMDGIQQTIGFYDNTESNLVELNMKMDLMNLFKELKLDYKSSKYHLDQDKIFDTKVGFYVLRVAPSAEKILRTIIFC